MNYYLIEVFESVNDNGFKYHHLSDSKTFTSEKEIKDRSYYKDSKYFVLSKLDNIDETKRKRRRNG